METLLMSEVRPAGAPMAGSWLEQAATADQGPRRIPLVSFPFRLGRANTTDLKIDSSRVSREHALIDCQDGRFVIRDLGSTNGTFVNGSRIEETELRDGDMVVIAEVEFTFSSGEPNALRDAATQVLKPAARRQETYFDIVRGVRRLHETLVSRCVLPRFEPVVRLEDGRLLGYESLACEEPGEHVSGLLRQATAECRLNLRLQQLRRLASADYAASLPPDSWLFVKVDPMEVGTEELVDSLAQLRHVLADEQRLIVELPDSMISDTPLLREFSERVRRDRMALAHDGFAAGAAQVRQLREIAPDYLKLSQGMVREVLRHEERRAQLQDVIATSRELGIQVIATGVVRVEEADLCRELGCPLAQGSFFKTVADGA